MTADLYSQLVSPEIHADGRVTFRVRAPQAQSVLLKGLPFPGVLPMTRSADGVWIVTTAPLAPERYSYLFEVDGSDQLDLHNRDVKKWLSLENQFEVPGSPPLLHEATNVPHGVLHHHWFEAGTLGRQSGVLVYTPPLPAANRANLPVLYLLHGYGDDETAWTEVGRAHCIVDNLIHQARIEPVVLVMPYGHPLPLDRSQPFDVYADQNLKWMERFLLHDIEPFVQKHYPITQDRSQRAITGLSMGGGQSLSIGLNHIDHFSHVGAFSSAAPQGRIFDQLSLWTLPPRSPAEQVPNLWIACGVDDFLLERNRTFHLLLEQRRVPHVYSETDGDHNWFVWRKYLAKFLQYAFPVNPA